MSGVYIPVGEGAFGEVFCILHKRLGIEREYVGCVFGALVAARVEHPCTVPASLTCGARAPPARLSGDPRARAERVPMAKGSCPVGRSRAEQHGRDLARGRGAPAVRCHAELLYCNHLSQ